MPLFTPTRVPSRSKQAILEPPCAAGFSLRQQQQQQRRETTGQVSLEQAGCLRDRSACLRLPLAGASALYAGKQAGKEQLAQGPTATAAAACSLTCR
jgi:hypothetical protein